MLSLSLVFQFPLGPSLCRGFLLRPGGRLSRLLRPGGRLSRLLRPGGHLSRLLRPCERLSRLLRPGGHLSLLLRPGGRLSRLLRPGGRLTCQSHLTPPLTCQSHLTPSLTCQSHLTSPLTCQSHLTPQQFTQCHFTSLLSLPPCPGGLLSHLPHMDLALRSLSRFHLRSTALLDCAVCEASGSRSLGGGGSVTNLVATHHISCTTLQLHITHGLQLPSFTALTTHTFPSTIAPITQLSPITH